MLPTRKLTAVALVLSLLVVSQSAFKCGGINKEKILPYAKETVSTLKDIRPILVAANYSVAKLDKAISAGDKLVAALESTGTGTGTKIELVASIINKVEDFAAETSLIKDPKTRTLILVGLAIADVALHRIADALAKDAESVPVTARRGAGVTRTSEQVILEFKVKLKYRCRDSVSGQFRKLQYCKENPATTQVERR